MYRIMIVKSHRDNYKSLYSWMTESRTSSNGEIKQLPVEFETEEEIDAKVEDMLNNGGYAKSDFIVVKYIDYTIYSHDYTEPSAGDDEQQNYSGIGMILRFDFDHPDYDDGVNQIYYETNGITWQDAYNAYLSGRNILLCKHAEYIYTLDRTVVDDKIYHLTGFGQNVGAEINSIRYENEIMFSISDEYRENGISARVLARDASGGLCLTCSQW